MAKKGRPRLGPEDYDGRLGEYCKRYGLPTPADGAPAFPAGKRETAQHREWLALYKLRHRLGRRQRGQCERCGAPCSQGTVFCEKHRSGTAAPEMAGATLDERRELHARQDGKCPVCRQDLDAPRSVARTDAGGRRSLLHGPCDQLVGLAEALGPGAVDRARAFLWPSGARRRGGPSEA